MARNFLWFLASSSHTVDMTEENRKLETKNVCYACGSTTTYRAQWYHNLPIGSLCKNCNNKFFNNPKWHPIKHKERIVFRDKQKQIKENPRVGVCNWCRAVKGEINAQTDKKCNRTHMNHESYHEDNLLEDTLEVCIPCHRRYHNLLGGEVENESLCVL